MIILASQLLTMTGEIYCPGWVEVVGNTIIAVGEGKPNRYHLELPNHILLPGLINCHCHLDYTQCRGQFKPTSVLANWIREMIEFKKTQTVDHFRSAIREGIQELMDSGTTSVVNIISTPEALPASPDPIRIWWAIEGIDVRQPFQFGFLPELRAISPHAPYTASVNLYRQACQIAQAKTQLRTNTLFTTHVGESKEEYEMFVEGKGPLWELLCSLGRDMTDCGQWRSPLHRLIEEGLLPKRSLIVHLNYFHDLDLLDCTAANHSIVHCPQSHAFFSYQSFCWEKIRAMGIRVVLGTDSLASSPSLNLMDEMRLFFKKHPITTPQAVLKMVTTEAAYAIGMEKRLGKVQVGYLADLIAIPQQEQKDPYAAVIEHKGKVPFLMAQGKILRCPFEYSLEATQK